jgi:Proteins of 100 residues with WXG.
MALNAHDDQSTLTLLAAFDQTMADCNAAQNAVDQTTSFMRSVWGGGAADEFTKAIMEWQDGLNQVKSALNMISGDMHSFHRSTHTTEQTSIENARWMTSASWT